MGFDGFGPSQVPRPAKPVDTSSFLSDVARRQRIDDRGIAVSASSVSAAAATRDLTTYGPVSGTGSAEITDLPAGIYAVTATLSLAWGSPLTVACTATVAAESGGEIAANTGSAAAGGTEVKAAASGFADLGEGSTLTATPTIFGGDPGATQTVTISAVRLGAAS